MHATLIINFMSLESPGHLEGKRNESQEDLEALAQLLNLSVIRHSQIGSTPTIVVRNRNDQEVHIGFPNGRHFGIVQPPLATGRIEGITMHGIGDGPWLYYIDI